ncbi:nicotinate-nucleotide pyrophosphorylase (carboxylating) [Natronomonas pharaonis DSM 2160]|uniref:Nicotinate-nucleotide pyrophosphorylase [carboxylating] n=1 Tax=Natronomonas pharaonis (strain ATCC 35678 / DSM 2160 / CIP 103997 / JCM 8858 / NBRC 14720 / NCIMB 2260 / Gabara) TaxID=348780 RepID=A0A1U7EW47_NATPD|nr:carboxylating nicotinate-nucleotide diphosphorylase [Natronomonas pharaonis]CAI49298.1 nicotinate-nucleotide pyrophosphorylase (carboxylating) [Natronomonas pharaonis DSM 2160]
MRIEQSQVERWLREDLGHHDVTNEVPGQTTGRLVATEPGVLAGLEAAAAVFEYLGVDIESRRSAGDAVEAGETVLRVSGAASDVLRGERVAVNIAGHASGVATKTRTAVERARAVAPDVAIAGTRKTTPGLRGVEKRAIAAGGGDTHRLDLSHMVMVKDNHIAEMGVETAIERFREQASFATQIEAEAETAEMAVAAAEAGADIVLLDNMSPSETADAAAAVPDGTLTEASGGITLNDVVDYAGTGVDIISLGSLTHSAGALDFSFRTGGDR